MNYDPVEAGVWVLPIRTLRDRDVEKEATGRYWCRVLIGNTHTPAPLQSISIIPLPPPNKSEKIRKLKTINQEPS